jgi:hypothetical protein
VRPNPDGNERLTAAIGVLLLVPIVAELGTVLLGVHTFMSLHVFVGLALIPAVLLKLGSTGWEDVPVAVDFRDGGPGVIVTSLRR